ncbi:MAG: ferritin-like domain-containing protein [Cyclobacteriaceae bacterium]
MILTTEQWDLSHLQEHLQYAVDLEFWTIPFYMSCMYSVEDRTSEAYQLIRTVVNQEMLHLQCAANIANVYGLSPTFEAPVYKGKVIPHLAFSDDDKKVTARYEPYTAEIGPLDEKHINAMCLIEIPEDETGHKPNLHDDVSEYGSIGEFYEATAYGAAQLRDQIKGGLKQVDFFSAFYRQIPSLTITESGDHGFSQVSLLIELITDQGEGEKSKDRKKGEVSLTNPFQNTADDPWPDDDHFEKFNMIKENKKKPSIFSAKPEKDYSANDKELLEIQMKQFDGLRDVLQQLFSGQNPQNFFPLMASVGGSIRNCWEHGITPKFS